MPKVNGINFPESMGALEEPEFSDVFNRAVIDQQCHDCRWFVPERGLCGFNVDDEAGDTLDHLYEVCECQVVPIDDCWTWADTGYVVPKAVIE